MKYNLIVTDPPWEFSDKLTMSDVKRGAGSQYDELNIDIIKALDVESIVADDAVMALWVPSAMIEEGLQALKDYGFDYKQTFVWGKRKVDPIEPLRKAISKKRREILKTLDDKDAVKKSFEDITELINDFDFNGIFQFGLGRTFRNCHEIGLVGVRGSVYNKREDRSQRTLFLAPNGKHSEKPEILQDRLVKMFPSLDNRLEMFARRDREHWTCVGYECPSTLNEDIRDSIKRLKAL